MRGPEGPAGTTNRFYSVALLESSYIGTYVVLVKIAEEDREPKEQISKITSKNQAL